MAPVRTISRERLNAIRNDIENSVVTIFRRRSRREEVLGTGFILVVEQRICVVVTVQTNVKHCSTKSNISVRFNNGQTYRGSLILTGTGSKLAAIVVRALKFQPVSVRLSAVEASQCESVVHMGHFDDNYDELNLSSGSVGVVNYNMTVEGRSCTRFSHCCSSKSDHIGGPVFNLNAELVGVNYSKRSRKNMFFAFDINQLVKELNWLLGSNWMDALEKYLHHYGRK